MSKRHKTAHYNGIAVFVKFVESESLTLTRDDLLELKVVKLLISLLRACHVLY